MNKKTTISRPQKINQILFYGLAIPLASHFLISIRERDTLWHRIHNPYYWIALGYSLVVCYLSVYVISQISKRLDLFDGKQGITFGRFLKQFVFGLLLPLCGITLLAAGYYGYFGENILEREYLVHELPIVALFLCVVNCYYLMRSFYEGASLPLESRIVEEQVTDNVVVYRKGEYVPTDFRDIAMIDQIELINWVVNFDGEKHMLAYTLKEISALLDGCEFFQINRKQILNRRAIKSFRPGTFGKLEVTLTVEQRSRVTVSKDRVKNFRAWLARKKP